MFILTKEKLYIDFILRFFSIFPECFIHKTYFTNDFFTCVFFFVISFGMLCEYDWKVRFILLHLNLYFLFSSFHISCFYHKAMIRFNISKFEMIRNQ